MVSKIPKKQKSVSILAPVGKINESISEHIDVIESDVPVPKKNQLLVKMAYASINPSDVAFIKGIYGTPLKPPSAAGFEGCGTVVASGGGLFTWGKVGKKVAFISFGTWAEYVVVEAAQVVTLADSVDLKQCASPIVNPMTCLSFMDIVKNSPTNAFIVNAAASALGRMTIRSALKNGFKPICMVRKEQQEQICKEEGAKLVVNTSVDGWEEKLKKIAKSNKATICFDAIGGEISMTILDAMPRKSTLYVYGGLAGAPFAQASIKSLIFQEKTITGYWATSYLKKKSLLTKLKWLKFIGKSLEGDLKSTIAEVIPLNDISRGIVAYQNNASDGKIIVDCSS